MEAVELLCLFGIGRPALAAIEECAEHAGLVHSDFRPISEMCIVPHSLIQTRN